MVAVAGGSSSSSSFNVMNNVFIYFSSTVNTKSFSLCIGEVSSSWRSVCVRCSGSYGSRLRYVASPGGWTWKFRLW